jgi:hypothetical protein
MADAVAALERRLAELKAGKGGQAPKNAKPKSKNKKQSDELGEQGNSNLNLRLVLVTVLVACVVAMYVDPVALGFGSPATSAGVSKKSSRTPSRKRKPRTKTPRHPRFGTKKFKPRTDREYVDRVEVASEAENVRKRRLQERKPCPKPPKDATTDHCQAMSKLLGSSISMESFMDDHYQKRHLHIPGKPNLCRGLAIDTVTSDTFLQSLKRNKCGISGKPLSFGMNFVLSSVREQSAGGRRYTKYQPHDAGEVDTLISDLPRVMREGDYSLAFNQMQTRVEGVRTLCHSLATVHGRACATNGYFSLPSQQGFSVHVDTQDTWIVQLEGSKYWEIYESFVVSPDHEQKLDLHDEDVVDINPPSKVVLLEEGDLLYMPRGLAHRVLATNTTSSAHITIGLETTFPPPVSNENSARQVLHTAIDIAARTGAKKSLWQQLPSVFSGTNVRLSWQALMHIAVHVISKRHTKRAELRAHLPWMLGRCNIGNDGGGANRSVQMPQVYRAVEAGYGVFASQIIGSDEPTLGFADVLSLFATEGWRRTPEWKTLFPTVDWDDRSRAPTPNLEQQWLQGGSRLPLLLRGARFIKTTSTGAENVWLGDNEAEAETEWKDVLIKQLLPSLHDHLPDAWQTHVQGIEQDIKKDDEVRPIDIIYM